ncbi:MAG: hypothetical protein ABSE07_11870 [Methanoregula sp.]
MRPEPIGTRTRVSLGTGLPSRGLSLQNPLSLPLRTQPMVVSRTMTPRNAGNNQYFTCLR